LPRLPLTLAHMPAVAVVPDPTHAILDAVRAAGGRVTEAGNADAIVWTDPYDADGLRALLDNSPARWVQLPFAGVERFIEAGVIDSQRIWTCAKNIYGPATAELALALIAAAARQIPRHARIRRWWTGRGEVEHNRIAGTTALIVGTGGIGRALTRMLSPLDVRVLAVNRSGNPLEDAERTERSGRLKKLLPEADWVVLAAAMTDETRHMIDADALTAMRDDAWLINVARGGLVDTDALVEALRADRIGGAGLDVTDPEPLPDDHPLWGFENVIITSHTANTESMALPELAALVRRNVERFAAGEPLEGLVDPNLGY
jgi:phosphoglycerate dehydrogenase-like enzyme